MIQYDPNLVLVETAASSLGDLLDRVVFVGGCAAGLLISDHSRPQVRATRDVDVICEVASLVQFHELESELRRLGFHEEGNVICRWRKSDLIIDVMPTIEEILGFSNYWYREAAGRPAMFSLPSGATIKLIQAPTFIATKLEAFYGRGGGDYMRSHDLEDLVNVVDGRPELSHEVAESPEPLRRYLQNEFDDLLADPRFVDALPAYFRGSATEQARVELVIQRMRSIARI